MSFKIKHFLWARRTDLLTLLIIVLATLAAFQLGRLSVLTAQTTGFQIIDL
jgi:hypothetical protein